MSGIFDILEKIKARPGMYIGKASVSDLFIFLAGYKTARREFGIEPTARENEFYGEFQPWLQKRFQVMSVNSWAKIIMLYSVDEREGFEYFFSCWMSFGGGMKVYRLMRLRLREEWRSQIRAIAH